MTLIQHVGLVRGRTKITKASGISVGLTALILFQKSLKQYSRRTGMWR